MSFVKFVDSCVDFGEAPAVDLFGRGWSKLASSVYVPAEVEQFLKTAKPIDGHRLLLVHGLGSSEYYGPNRNGDAFPEMWKGAKNLIEDNPSRGYGFKTFEKNAYTFRDHRNHDPKLTIGGKVVLAAWNDKMHRVELILPVSEKLAPDVVDAIDKGEKIAVSMGCFIAGTRITLADGTTLPIEQIKIGSTVMTHRGRGRKVTSLHTRPYEGVFFKIHAEAHEPFVCTREHPLLVVERDQVKKSGSGGARWLKDISDIQTKWIHAECLDPDKHFLLEPVLDDVLTPEYADKAFARLLGYYVAEGHVLRGKSKEICGVEFTVNKTDAIVQEINELCAAFGTRNTPYTRERGNSEHALSISVFDDRLARMLYEHGGAYAKTKRMSAEFMQWHPDIQREFLGAFANGDGCGTDDGCLKLSTGSSDLANQLRLILARMGIAASVSNLIHKAGSGFSAHTTSEWVIHIGKQWAQALSDVCAKVQPSEVLLTKNSRMFARGFIITPIRSMEAYRSKCDVFNFEVEDDESYVAAGLAVHNCRVPHDVCSICGNKAKHRGQYCKHAAYQMNEVMDDGRKVYVDNPEPNFFDISVLGHRGQGRPADASAYSIMKVAGAEVKIFRPGFKSAVNKASEEKRSDIDKQVPAVAEVVGGPAEADHQGLLEQLMAIIKKLIPFDMGTADGPSTRTIVSIRRIATTPEKKVAALSTITAAGFILEPEDLDQMALLNTKIDFSKVSSAILQVLRPDMPEGSLWLPYFGDRVYRHKKLGTVMSSRPARDFASYKNYVDTVKTALTTKESMMKLAAAVDTNFALKMAITRDDLADLQKYAAPGGGISGENLVAAMLAPLLAGAYFRSQQYSGQPIGPIRSVIADHPIATGIVGALLWHKLKGGRIPLIQS